jgi:lysophospholipase L1-like esterase
VSSREGRCILQGVAVVLAAAVASAAPRDGHDPGARAAPRARATLLVVGDSLVGGPFAFAKAIREQLRDRNVRVVQDTWVGVGVQRFAANRRFRDLIAQHRPTHVLVVLGTNDYLLPAPQRAASSVERIAARAAAAVASVAPLRGEHPPGAQAEPSGSVRCAWIGPLVPKDTGIVQVIADHAAPCRFIDSRRFGVPTIRDGFHPSVTGAYLWADGVLQDLAGEGWTWEP